MIGPVVFLLIETSQICSFRIGRTRCRSIRFIDRDPHIYSIVEIGLRAEYFACLLRSTGKLARVAFDRKHVRNCRECEEIDSLGFRESLVQVFGLRCGGVVKQVVDEPSGVCKQGSMATGHFWSSSPM